MPPRSFGKYLRRKRKEKQMSQRTLAEETGVDFSYLSKVENDVPGFASVSEPTLTKLAAALEVDSDEMITRAGKIPSDVKRMLVDDFSLVKEIRQRKRSGSDPAGGSK
jgi:HTH-type transcriptional regulator, competence development regulator